MIVVADTGPVNYLILSGHVDLVHELYGALLIPTAVHGELLDARAPLKVREWANALPVWAEARKAADPSRFADLGPGEREAISLALEVKAGFVLIDETLGRKVAVKNNVAVKGTLGILEEAANRGLVNLSEAVQKLRTTGIFLSDEIVEGVLKRHRDRGWPNPFFNTADWAVRHFGQIY
jgi:predicted nucleic acid-binding protein